MSVLRQARERGAADAASRLGFKNASALMDLLAMLGTAGGTSVARGAIGAAAPNLLPKLEGLGAAMVPKFLRRGQTAMQAAPQIASRLPTSPAILR